jgi:hypothetical protein
MVFCGWHHADNAQARAERTGYLTGTTLQCVDVAGKLDKLPGFTQSVEGNDSPSAWTEMVNPNMDLYLHYLLHWHSTALEVADWTDSGTGSNFPFVILGSGGESLFDQVNRRAQALVPDYHLTCNRLGQLDVVVDPMLQDTGDRSATIQAAIGEDDWREIMFPHKRPPRVHWLRSDAILADADTITAIFSVAPGETPGQGEMVRQQSEQLAQSQADLNACEGHRYARLNAKEGFFTVTLVGNDDLDIDPASMEWVSLQITADTAMERGYTWDVARGLVHELNISYEHTKTGLLKTVMARWEREVDGPTAVTEDAPDPPDDPPPPYIPPPWEPPEEDPGLWPDAPQMAIAYGDGGPQQIGWCPDIMAPGGPSWVDVTGTLNGMIIDVKYIQTGSDSVAAWCLTKEGVYYTDNVLSGSAMVSAGWSGKLDSDDVDVAIGKTVGTITFRGIALDQSDPDFCIVLFTRGSDTQHMAYTTDRGASWSYSTWSGSSGTNRQPYGFITINQNNGTIYAADRVYDPPHTGYYTHKSTDGGANFSRQGYPDSGYIAGAVDESRREYLVASIYSGALYLSISSGLNYDGTTPEGLRKSTDGGGSWMDIAPGGTTNNGQVVPFPLNDTVWFVKNHDDLYKSTDGGGSWSFVKAIDTVLSGAAAKIEVWPGDEDLIFGVSLDDGLNTGSDDDALMYSDDGGENWTAIIGDWNTVFGAAWSGAAGSGFSVRNVGIELLPRIGANE